MNDVLSGLGVGITSLTKYQTEALYNFLCGHDTFAVLPTEHGKSLVYPMSVFIANAMKLNYSTPVIVVVSPLNALIARNVNVFAR